MLREIANDEQILIVNWRVMFDERASVQSQALEQGEHFTKKKMTWTGNLHNWALAQKSCSSIIIITSWLLHVQVFAVSESTEDETVGKTNVL